MRWIEGGGQEVTACKSTDRLHKTTDDYFIMMN